MPINLVPEWQKGWDKNVKHSPNDPILCMSFRDEKSGRTLFLYAPKLSDLSIWVKFFAELGTYEMQKVHRCSDLEKTSNDDTGGKESCHETK
jgi:hypothetical protein